MKRRALLTCLLITIPYYSSFAPNTIDARVLAMICQEMVSPDAKEIDRASYLLYRIIPRKRAVPLTPFERRLITCAVNDFHTVSGFFNVMLEIVKHPENFKGAFFEIAFALHLARVKGHKILSFHDHKSARSEQREFDLTSRSPDGRLHWFECKTSNWQVMRPHYMTQFQAQSRVARRTSSQIKYVVATPNAFTPAWRKWLNEKKIIGQAEVSIAADLADVLGLENPEN